jgi:transposase
MGYLGVDLHTNRFTADFRNGKKEEKLISYHLGDLQKFVSSLHKDDYVFVEASVNTFAFSDRIRDYVKEVIVIDPFQFRVIADSGKKTDKIDAKKIAKMGQYHIETGRDFLPEVYIPEVQIRKLRSLFTTYNLITKELTMTKNRIYSLYKEQLEPLDEFTYRELKENFEAIALPEEHKLQVRLLFDLVKLLEEKKEAIKREILLLGEPYLADIELLVSISGISVFMALGLIADYGTVERFENGKEFSKYLRSTPRSEVSNEKVKNGKTYKSGRKLAIKLLLQGMNHFVSEGSHIAQFYYRLKKGKGACKARMAVMRKLFVIIFHMLKNQEYYRYMKKALHEKKMKEYESFLQKNKKVA